MVYKVFEESTVVLQALATRGKKKAASKSVAFTFEQTGGATKLAKASVKVAGDTAKLSVVLPKLKDDEKSYKLKYKYDAGDGERDGGAEFEVWPKTLQLQTVDKDGKEFPWVEFRVVQGGAEAVRKRSGAGASIGCDLPVPDEAKVEAISPYLLDGLEGEGRARRGKFSRMPYKAALFGFLGGGGGTRKQYVNLKVKAGSAEGSKITVQVGAEEDDIRAKGTRQAKKDDPIYVKVKFDKKASKRNNPKREAVGFTDAGDGVFTQTLKIPADGEPVKFDVELGQAGGDRCTIDVGVTDKCEDGSVTIENWRKLYYQLTCPKGTAAPDFTRLKAALKEVFIEYDKYKDLEIPDNDGPAGVQSWFPGEWLNEAGKTLINIGDYNKAHFHAKFVDDKTPVGVHVLCCHTQYDCLGASTKKDFVNVEVDSTKTALWSDGTKPPGTHVWVGEGFFPKKMKDGTSSLLAGSWKEKGGAGTGNITDADVWIDRKTNPGFAFIKLPAAAKAIVDGGGKVKLTLSFYCALGPYLGESDGTNGWLQLIVVKQSVNPLNDVMAHELGHTMNQVTKSAPPGLTAADHGRKYTGNGHQGPHCADGMSSANYNGGAGKAGGSYAGDFTGKKECTCIMYGENGDGSTCTGKFCDRCKPFINAESLSTLH